jgi:alpha-L-fucosidase
MLPTMAIRTSLLLAAGAALLLGACSGSPAAPNTGANDAAPGEARMDWWREARFGLFLHWGLYAVPAGVWNDADHHGEWIMDTAQIPVETYEGFAERFDPVKFDADEWARMAAEAGMRYVVITTKHHDGFALFDSQVGDYDVMATPFRRDVMAELAEACRRRGLKMCWYHSIMDWHHPTSLPRRGWETRGAGGADFRR